MQDGPKHYRQLDLMRALAEETFETQDLSAYARNFGSVTGFADNTYTIIPGATVNTSHLVFLKMIGIRIGIDGYGDVHCYLPADNPIQHHLCCIAADAKRLIEDTQEVNHVDPDHYSDIADDIERKHYLHGRKYGD